ncbi:TetR family transcriptional regulator [Bacillus sp. 7586-K]|uniref:TetR/AcrR family transcriptional regulator n=1 Tax=Metabacillus niabensis TaxID=324854 RepID=UPI000BA73197|nr:TetR family transcriptional regulator [Bacillus sp. 7586-K]
MPKIVDHEKRRKQIAEATWRVILNEGIEGATVRNIAKEANISLGALRYYFATQDELLVYAMNLVKEQATERIKKIVVQDSSPKEIILNVLLELLPVNEETKAEMEVWFAFIGHVRHKQGILKLHDDGVYEGIKVLVENMVEYGLLKDGLDKEMETERLYSLIDGLALHAILEPGRLNKEKITRVLTYHLESIWV